MTMLSLNKLKNEQGIALITALMFTLIALGLILVLMYMITSGIKVSAASKRYKNVVEAGYGGVSLTVNEIIPRVNNAIFGNYSSGLTELLNDYGSTNVNLQIADRGCLRQKLDNATADWGVACGSSTRTLDPRTSPDLTFVLKSNLPSTVGPQIGYKVYTKIVSTPVKGNTDKADKPNLRNNSNITESEKNQGTGVTIPTTYRIEVSAENEQNPLERSNLSVLYAY
jgi:hypothetical protein